MSLLGTAATAFVPPLPEGGMKAIEEPAVPFFDRFSGSDLQPHK
jgi:hypothetical protein